jgi:DNA-binding IclR family transcriptional regulator
MSAKSRTISGVASKSTFLTSHAFVLIHIARNPHATLREIGAKTKLTERTVYKIVRDLEDDGYIVKRRDGRRNVYAMNEAGVLGHRLFGSLTVAQLVEMLGTLAGANGGRWRGDSHG